ncbi:hypothetical protein [Mycobacterium sp. ACS4331]|uniref:hypothetical protein n=1 Tax=Mycobacterium sp. ACS4331 TaxID=1834121 RepID=UPI0007FFD10B|nr:hypothetical protein [Mycobacterium sp. ACS4331]OBF09926.1 hypothetical protein A5727_21740 [Mycobacterium sp. ACS4331]
MSRSFSSALLEGAAFGECPGTWPLPAADTLAEGWWRAVAAAGQGHYGQAFSELAGIRRCELDGPLRSLALSTHASLLRQLGWHGLARGWDGRALLAAGSDVDARLDALVGLAADALGTARFAASERLLCAARAAMAEGGHHERAGVRVQWVSAELAMASGRGDVALDHARRGVELAHGQRSVRHRVKSDVVLAAALCCAGRVDDARTHAEKLLDETAHHGLIPLHWAVASLLCGIGSATRPDPEMAQIRDAAAKLVEHRGGVWCVR